MELCKFNFLVLIKKIFILSILLLSQTSFGNPYFVKGFNVAWTHNDYGTYLNKNFDPLEIQNCFKQSKKFGGEIVRMWLFEGINFDGVIWQDNLPVFLNEKKLENIKTMLELAKKENVQLYLTIFDGNIVDFLERKANLFRKKQFIDIFNNYKNVGNLFLNNILAPVLTILYDYREQIFGIDLINEFNFVANPGPFKKSLFESNWKGAKLFLAKWKNFISDFDSSKNPIKISASFGHSDAIDDFLSFYIMPDEIDFYDLHLYNDNGDILKFDQIQSVIKERKVKVLLGEFGQKAKRFDDALQSLVTRNFLQNSRKIGFIGALAWRLFDLRSGYNPEARYSYFSHGDWRDAVFDFETN